MTTEAQKHEIKKATLALVKKRGLSRNSYAKSVGVSPATISLLVNENWGAFGEEMWRKLRYACGLGMWEWQTAEIANFKIINVVLEDTQGFSNSKSISDDAGYGKSHAYKYYAQNNENVYLLQCSSIWTQKVFFQKLLQALGIDGRGLPVYEMAEKAITALKAKHKPLVILDEVDKLRDSALLYFIDMYNQLDGVCGFMLSGSPFWAKKVWRSAQLDKRGYREIFSRVGRKFISLDPITVEDIQLVCKANGVDVTEAIGIYDSSDQDMRRVRREIERIKVLQEGAGKEPAGNVVIGENAKQSYGHASAVVNSLNKTGADYERKGKAA